LRADTQITLEHLLSCKVFSPSLRLADIGDTTRARGASMTPGLRLVKDILGASSNPPVFADHGTAGPYRRKAGFPENTVCL
jgi:hypothetical protein